MGYCVYYEEMITFVHQVNELCQKWNEALDNISKKEKALEETKYLEGKAADKIRTYLNEVHGSILIPMLQELVYGFDVAVGSYLGGYIKEVDGGNGGHTGNYCYNTLIYDELNSSGEVPHKFTAFMDRASDLDDMVNSVRKSVCDLISLCATQGEDFVAALDAARNIAISTHDKVSSYESSHKGDLDNFDAALTEVKSVLSNQLSKQRVMIIDYTSGAITAMCNFENLSKAAENIILDIDKMQESYAIGVNAFGEMKEFKDYEIREKKAKWIKIGVAITATIGMTVLTVCTAGAATVVGCAFIGAAKGVMNVVTDVYVEKGSGTSFLGNALSGDFYNKWDDKDWLALKTGALKGGVEGVAFALSAAAPGSALKQPISTALRKTAIKSGETFITSGIDMYKDVGEAMIDKKPWSEIQSIIKDDAFKMLKNTTANAASAFVTGYIGASQSTSLDDKGLTQKLKEGVFKTGAETTTKHFIETGWDVGRAALDGDSSTTVSSVLSEHWDDYKQDIVKKEIGATIGVVSDSLGDKLDNIENKFGKYTSNMVKDTVLNTSDSFAQEVAGQIVNGDAVDFKEAWDTASDGGRNIVKNAAESLADSAKEDVDTFKRDLLEKSKDGHVEVVTFENGVDGVLKQDYEAALENAGKGAYKDMSVQQMLGLANDVDVSPENVNLYNMKVDDLRKTELRNANGEKVTIRTKATNVTIPYEDAIQRIKDEQV